MLAATIESPEICPLVLCRTSVGNRPRIFLFHEIKVNIVNKPLKINIALKLTINYNYLLYNIYSNMIVLFKALIIKYENVW